jgi:hypothetical protein
MSKKKNASCTYFFPLILNKITTKKGQLGIMNHLVNTYLFTDDNNMFTIILNKRDFLKGKVINNDLTQTIIDSKIDKKISEKTNEVIISFKIPEDLDKTREKFINGDFSKIEEDHKCQILEFIFQYGDDELKTYKKVSGILNKDKKLRDEIFKKLDIKDSDIPENIELRSKINIKEETYKDYAKNQ